MTDGNFQYYINGAYLFNLSTRYHNQANSNLYRRLSITSEKTIISDIGFINNSIYFANEIFGTKRYKGK
jgi:hypothetical protein